MPNKGKLAVEFYIHVMNAPVIEPGHIRFGEDLLRVPSCKPISLIGSGANGFVVLCENEYLNRTEAVKFWTVMRPSDNRDKIRQGLEEARKAVAAADEQVATVYSAGILNNKFFYTTSEYVQGITLFQFLKKPHQYYDRLKVAYLYLSAIINTAKAGVVSFPVWWTELK